MKVLGLVVGASLLLSACGSGGGVASTATAPVTNTTTATSTSSVAASTVQDVVLEQQMATLIVKSLFDQNLKDFNSIYCCSTTEQTLEEHNERYYTLQDLKVAGAPIPDNGLMMFSLVAQVKSKDTGAAQVWDYTIGVDRVTHRVVQISSTKE